MCGPDSGTLTPVVFWALGSELSNNSPNSLGKQNMCMQEHSAAVVPYVVLDPAADRRNRSDVRKVVEGARVACRVEIEWRDGDLDLWQWTSERNKDGDGTWDVVVAGDILESISLQHGGELMARIARGRHGDGMGVLLLATSASSSTNPDLLELDRIPRR